MRLGFHMLPIIYNQKLKQAEILKNNYKLKDALNILNDFEDEKVLTNRERVQFFDPSYWYV